MNIGDRVKFRTIGGWYNSGIIRDINEDSYLIEVDELGSKPPEDVNISLPYHARVLSCEIVDKGMTNEEAIARIQEHKINVYTKDEVIAMLTEIQLKIKDTVKEEELIDKKWANGLHYSEKIIQQKINELEGNTSGNDESEG